jgi:methyltransferase (TIGR00027 family)
MAARTRFFDSGLLHACERGVGQVVIVGAGYDGRPLRFRRPGVTFYELDHPATQADKRARLAEVAAMRKMCGSWPPTSARTRWSQR